MFSLKDIIRFCYYATRGKPLVIDKINCKAQVSEVFNYLRGGANNTFNNTNNAFKRISLQHNGISLKTSLYGFYYLNEL